MQAVLDDWTTADIPERTRAALRLLEAMTLRPLEIDGAFVDALREDGLDDESIREAANVGFHYNLINRVADAFDFPIPKPEAKAKLAKMLNMAGKLLKGARSDRLFDRDDGAGRTHPAEVHVGRERMLSVEGVTSPELRVSVERFVLAEWDHVPAGEAPPAELHTYLRKLARHAFKITDEDVEALREEGYDDDALYEITMVGSFAAALVGLERVYGVMYGEVSAAA